MVPSWDAMSRSDRLFFVCGSARVVTILTGICILLMLKRQQYRARHGDIRAARAVLLPMYEPMILIMLTAMICEYGFLYINYIGLRKFEFVTVLAQFSLNSFVQTGLVAFFCSHSLSHHSLLRSVTCAFAFAIFGFICAFINQRWNRLAGLLLFNGVPIIFLWCVFKKMIYRRKAIVPYLKFMMVYRLVWELYSIFASGYYIETAYYVTLLCIALMEVPLCVLWYFIMWSDTYFWRTGGVKLKAKFSIVKSIKRLMWRYNAPFTIITNFRKIRVAPIDPATESSYEGTRHDRLDEPDFDMDSDDEDESHRHYEREAMERIAMLQAQSDAFERLQAERRLQRAEKRRKRVQQHRDAHDSPFDATHADANSHIEISMALTDGSTDHSIDSNPTSSASPPSSHIRPSTSSSSESSIPPSSSKRRLAQPSTSLPPESTLLAQGSDMLLSRDIQQLIEANKHRFIDFALLRMDGETMIGSGGSSNVYAGFYRNFPVALKFFTADQEDELTSESIAAYAKETSLAASFNHPSIVQFIGLCVRPPAIFLVMELCEAGSLFNVLPQLRGHPYWSYQAVLNFAVQAAAAIEYLHSGGYVHRDIKSLNYMVNKRGELKLTDFGLSRMFPQFVTPPQLSVSRQASSRNLFTSTSSSAINHQLRAPLLSNGQHDHNAIPLYPSVHSRHNNPMSPSSSYPPTSTTVPLNLLTRRVGSRCWMSPEMRSGGLYSLSSDIYSLTVVLWEILTCNAPFDEVAEEDLNDVLSSGVTPSIPDWCPSDYRNLLLAGWNRDPTRRPTAKEMHQQLKQMLKQHEQEYGLETFDPSVFFQNVDDEFEEDIMMEENDLSQSSSDFGHSQHPQDPHSQPTPHQPPHHAFHHELYANQIAPIVGQQFSCN